jgi:hypothetical protein
MTTKNPGYPVLSENSRKSFIQLFAVQKVIKAGLPADETR